MIFLSYRRDDTGGFAPGIYGLLADQFGKENVAWDFDVKLGLKSPLVKRSYAQYLRKRIQPNDVYVVLIGRRWLRDQNGRRPLDDPTDPHRQAIEVALARGSFVIPLLLAGAAMPHPDDLPPTLARLAEAQALELNDRTYLADMKKLAKIIERAQQGNGAAPDLDESVEHREREEELVTVAQARVERGEVELAAQTATLIEDEGRRSHALESIAEALEQREAETHRPLPQLPFSDLLSSAGLVYAQAGDTLATTYRSERGEPLVVTASTVGAEEELAVFAVDLPPARLKASILRNLLRASFDADYLKAVVAGDEQLRLAAELPAQIVTPLVARGLADGLARLGDVTARELTKPEQWAERVSACEAAQGRRIHVDLEQARAAVPAALAAAGLEVAEGPGDAVSTKLQFRDTGERYPVAVRPRHRAISLIAYTPLRPKGDEVAYMRRLLELNAVVSVARVGLDRSGDIALLYEVPELYPSLMDDVQVQFDLLLFGIFGLEAGE